MPAPFCACLLRPAWRWSRRKRRPGGDLQRQRGGVFADQFPGHHTRRCAGTLGRGTDTIRAKGSLLASAAGIVFYHQMRGELSSPNGLADPLTLNAFLQTGDGFMTIAGSTEQTVNLWRWEHSSPAISTCALSRPIRLPFARWSREEIPCCWLWRSRAIRGRISWSPLASPPTAASDLGPRPFLRANQFKWIPKRGRDSRGCRALLPQAPSFPKSFLIVSNNAVQVSSVAGVCGATLSFPGIAADRGADALDDARDAQLPSLRRHLLYI